MKLKVFVVSLFLSYAITLFAGVSGHWDYTGEEDPNHWGELKPEFFMCKDGKNQSPVNINKERTILASGLKDMKFHYVTGATQAVNNGHTIQVSVASGSYVEIDNIKFELKQFHFHSPSENQINGENFPLEAHFVHISKDGQLAVVAVMYKEAQENKILKKICNKIFSNIDKVNKCKLTTADINALLPQEKSYFRFEGSLTTPPCSEGVRWIVLKNSSHISSAQADKFVNVMMKGHNNRPVQPTNARMILQNK